MSPRRRRVKDPLQLEFDLWGPGETAADAQLSLARGLQPGPHESTGKRGAVNRHRMRAPTLWQQWMSRPPAGSPRLPRRFTPPGRRRREEIANLAILLAGRGRKGETRLQKAARLAAARRQAEEIVMANLVWAGDPQLPLDQAREEWEQTRASDENLVSWAERIQDCPESMPSTQELEELARTWAISPDFLHCLVDSQPPRTYLLAHLAELQEAATIRFLRELR